MAYEVVRSEEADHDLELIFDHLVETYMSFGDPLREAFGRARKRVASIESDIESLSLAPYQGTLRSGLRPGLRQVTKNQTIFYFTINDADLIIRILAIFFGGQDHQRHILARIGGH